jgi:hypothetical protein
MQLDGKQIKDGTITNAKLATPGGTATKDNKNMVALVTAVDGDKATATAIAHTPASGGYVEVQVNGDTQNLGDGVKTLDCYFSGDGGTTARAMNAIVAGDFLYWNGSIALYQLAVTDHLNFLYDS